MSYFFLRSEILILLFRPHSNNSEPISYFISYLVVVVSVYLAHQQSTIWAIICKYKVMHFVNE